MTTPFRIEIPQSDLDYLRARLETARWADHVPGVGWSLGVPVDYVRTVAEYWRTGFDWRAAEATLNQHPQFTTVIEGQTIHFLHVRSTRPDALPLMLIHGWPSSFVEFLDVIGPLREDFHLVVPAVPGFGFSSPLSGPGWNDGRIAAAFIELMRRLGYDHYGVQGGDVGALVAPEMARQAGEHVVGLHLNAILTMPSGEEGEEGELDALTEAERARWKRMEEFNDGYLQIQSKRPQTLAHGLHDSPVGQLAWIMDGYVQWTDSPLGRPEEAIDLDRMLTNVSLFWFTGTAGSSAQYYHEMMNNPAAWAPTPRGTTPTAVLVASTNEVAIRPWAEREHNIVRWTEYDRGGHFFAMEEPDLFAADVREFFGKLVA